MFNPSQNLLGKFRCLSQKSDCLLFALARTLALAVFATFSLACLSSLYRFQGSLAAALATTYDSIAKAACFVNTFPNSFFRKFLLIYIRHYPACFHRIFRRKPFVNSCPFCVFEAIAFVLCNSATFFLHFLNPNIRIFASIFTKSFSIMQISRLCSLQKRLKYRSITSPA